MRPRGRHGERMAAAGGRGRHGHRRCGGGLGRLPVEPRSGDRPVRSPGAQAASYEALPGAQYYVNVLAAAGKQPVASGWKRYAGRGPGGCCSRSPAGSQVTAVELFVMTKGRGACREPGSVGLRSRAASEPLGDRAGHGRIAVSRQLGSTCGGRLATVEGIDGAHAGQPERVSDRHR